MCGLAQIVYRAAMGIGLVQTALAVLKDYMRQRKEGKNPEFHAADIGITGTDYWN